MTALRCGHHGWHGGTISIPVPTEPDPVPGYEPIPIDPRPFAPGAVTMVRVGDFPGTRDRGLLWNARVEPSDRSMEAGGNTVTITCPATPQNMRILGDPIVKGWDQAGRKLYSNTKAISRELIVGSNDNGKARRRYVIRDPWTQSGGLCTIKGVGIIGGLTADRTIGAPTVDNLLTNRIGSFQSGDLTGWRLVGPNIHAGVTAGGPDGPYNAWVTGTPDGNNYIEARVRLSRNSAPYGWVKIAGTAYVRLPGDGLDIDSYGLISIGVTRADGTEFWPGNHEDAGASVVESNMRRGVYETSPVECYGFLPTPPYTVDAWVRLHPTDEVQRTYYAGVQEFRRGNTATPEDVDITLWPYDLFRTAQEGRDKSPWGVTVSFGEPCGVSDTGVWWHADGQSMNEALEGACSRGPIEVYDYPDGHRTVRSTKRRGSLRFDLAVRQWDLLGTVSWQVDPGGQRTAARGTSAAATMWGGSDEGAIDTSQADGQIIDVNLSGPVGMTPTQLRAWLKKQLRSMRLIQASMTLLVRPQLGQRISVGDSLSVAVWDGAAGHTEQMRVHAWTPNYEAGFIALDVGSDELA